MNNRTERILALYSSKIARLTPQETKPVYRADPTNKATLDGDFVLITFRKSRETVALIKRITQRAYIQGVDIQLWEAPVSLDCLDKLREGKFILDASILQWEQDLYKPVTYDPNFTIPDIKHWDYFEQYQKEGVQFIEAKKGRALISDDPGLGKTMQTLAWLQLRQDINPVLIICPANAKWTWWDEAFFWLNNPNVQMINGNANVPIWGDFVIINYDILTCIKEVWDEEKGKNVKKDTFRKDIWDEIWQCIIIDEGHYIGNSDTIRGWAVEQIVERTPHCIIATATPGDKNKHKFTLAHLINKQIFPSFFKFAHRFCDPKKNYVGGWDFNGSSNELELNELLTSTIMLRRTKQEVFKNYTRILRQVISLPIDNRAEYEKADINFDDYLRETKGIQSSSTTFQKIEALTQLAVKGKTNAAIDWIWELLNTSKKIIIFCEHKTTVDMLMDEFKGIALKIDGSTSDKKREEAKQTFQGCKICGVRKEKHAFEDKACAEYVYDMKCRVLIGSRAMKESATLTAAYDEIFYELWWSADDHTQAEGRAYLRKGDPHGATAWYLIAHGTIEEHRANIYDLKNMRNEKVMNGKHLSKEMMLTELIKEYRGK
jgi:SWI/SNF-related matrix-associated actin-dependent regulator of chromatin subfamily A-like protein 1